MKISDMTKLFLCLTAMLMMVACGNNKSRSSEDADSEAETELTEQDDDEDADWEGSLSLPRELRVANGRLIQTPIPAVKALRGAELPAEGALPAACALEVGCPGGDFELSLFTRADGSGGLRLRYDAGRRVCTVDKRGMDKRFNARVGEVLDMPLDAPLTKLEIYADRSSVEIFANDGEATFTTHLYPTGREFNYTASEGLDVHIWPMARSVTDEFVV